MPTEYYVFTRKSLVGCWADSLEEAQKHLAQDEVDVIDTDLSGELVQVTKAEPNGDKPFEPGGPDHPIGTGEPEW